MQKIIGEHNLSTALDLTQLSDWLGLSEPYLLRIFHRQIGKTVRQQLLELRMSKAPQLLRVPSMPIKQIALDCGYNNVSNFYRDFKSVYRTTPKDVRLGAIACLELRITIPSRDFHTKAPADNEKQLTTIVVSA